MKQLLYLTAAFLVGSILTAFLMGRAPTEPTEETVTIYDTIPYHYPVARDSVVVRYETHRLPLADVRRDTIRDTVVVDSVEVIVPITQKEYRDSTYHLWISGYAANLDSIHTFTRHDYTTVTVPPAKPKHWHLGITAGFAVTPKGVQPYIGAGITYSFKTF
ncbi:MAG: hypothetical protein K2L28_04045 [Muribaculaceae bacterium]|nr:hypothetical protein [Muribaculaceae bacterium]